MDAFCPPPENCPKIWFNIKSFKGTVIGIFILLLVATFNVLAEQTSKSLVGALSAPFFIQYFSTAWLIGTDSQNFLCVSTLFVYLHDFQTRI